VEGFVQEGLREVVEVTATDSPVGAAGTWLVVAVTVDVAFETPAGSSVLT
jgi:hypothetical protein